jgi:transposase-like protein
MSRKRRTRSPQTGGFHPPCCPNPRCSFHISKRGWRFVRDGHHIRASDRRRFQDFRCRACGRRFCPSAFSTAYWLRRRDLLLPIASLLCEGAALRQIARALATSHTTVARHAARLGRHCLLFHRDLLRGFPVPEPLVIDGFESFEFSQYFPFHANLATGARSWFLYHFTDSPLRRKGSMTPAQRRRRAQLEEALGRPDPKAIEHGIAALLHPLLRRLPPGSSLTLHSDDHPAYPRALRHLRRQECCQVRIQHRTTSSTERRTRRNPLFPVNLADLLLRHASANHRRETIAFSKRRQAALERLAVFTVWRNCIKRRRENGPRESAAMWLGRLRRLLTWRDVLRRRHFPQHGDLPAPWEDYYWRRIRTAALGARQTAHTCVYTF